MEVLPNRTIRVPVMTKGRVREILAVRLMLEVDPPAILVPKEKISSGINTTIHGGRYLRPYLATGGSLYPDCHCPSDG